MTAEPAADNQNWTDLALNQPGAAVRAKQHEIHAEQPLYHGISKFFGIRTAETSWRTGAVGEELVGAQLAKLQRKDPRWQVLHSLPIGEHNSDIDHLIIGPGGIFTVNTKHHKDARISVYGKTFYINGSKNLKYIPAALYEATRASKALSRATHMPVPVAGLIVVVNAADLKIKSKPAELEVIWRSNLVNWLRNLDQIHTNMEVETVYSMARRSTTWNGV